MRLGSFGKYVALVLGALSIATSAAGQSASFKAAVFGARQTPYPGAAVALDFVGAATGGQQYYQISGVQYSQFSSLPGLTISRATPPVSYAATASGVLAPFSANTARITDQGLLAEDARTNVVLWNRDLTNAAWTKTNITAVLNQTGADGSPNSASSLTATAGNGTALQAVTLASSARFQSAFVKRITGSGTIQMTTDNGATWTAISVASSYSQLTIPTQTLANPTVGFRIVTSGDAIAVDLVQNENGIYASSPIPTTTVAVTRAADVVTIASISYLQPFTTVASALVNAPNASSANQTFFELDDGTDNNRVVVNRNGASARPLIYYVDTGGVNQAAQFAVSSVGPGIKTAVATRWSNTSLGGSSDGAAVLSVGGKTMPVTTTLRLGNIRAVSEGLTGYLRRFVLYPTSYSDAQLLGAAVP